MGYAQWIEINVQAEGLTVSVRAAGLTTGKFYKNGNKDSEMSVNEVNALDIASGKQGTIAACGSSNAWAGTEGGFNLYDGSTKIARFQWNCPWDNTDNYYDLFEKAAGYNLSYSGGNRSNGAIGNVTIVCIKN